MAVAFDGLPAYAFTPGGIREGAPEASGIYAIFTPTQWVLIADADNIRKALFRLLDAPTECLQSHHPLSFSCEDVPRSERQVHLDSLIRDLQPRCNGPRADSR